MTTQFKKRFTDDPYYAPNRDVAYIYSSMLRKAVAGLDMANWEDWYGDYLEHHTITESDLAEGVRRFCAAHNLFRGQDHIEAPHEALEETGFYAMPYPVQIVIYARLGMILTGTFFMAVRDVTELGQDPPPQVEFEELLRAGEEIMREYMKTPWRHFLGIFTSLGRNTWRCFRRLWWRWVA